MADKLFVIDHIGVGVRDYDESRSFYQRALAPAGDGARGGDRRGQPRGRLRARGPRRLLDPRGPPARPSAPGVRRRVERAGGRLPRRGARGRWRATTAPLVSAPSTATPTTPPTCSTRTATTSRPCSTAPRRTTREQRRGSRARARRPQGHPRRLPSARSRPRPGVRRRPGDGLAFPRRRPPQAQRAAGSSTSG